MTKIKILAAGYYDRNDERFALLKAGEVLTVSEHQGEAPCRSKKGNGLWTTCGVFVETQNMEIIKCFHPL